MAYHLSRLLDAIQRRGQTMALLLCLLLSQALPAAPFACIVRNRNSDDGGVVFVDAAMQTLGDLSVAADPQAIAITPDGTMAYVCVLSAGAILPIDLTTVTPTPGTLIPVGVEGSVPQSIAITPDGTMAYVCCTALPRGGNTVVPIDLTTPTPTPETFILMGAYPFGIAITPDGTMAYVSDIRDNTVTPIDLLAKTADTPIPMIEEAPGAIAITPDGTMAYVCNQGPYGYGTTVTPINLVTKTVGESIPVGNDPSAIAITPDGTMAYVCNYGDGTVTPIDLTTPTPTPWDPVSVEGRPSAIAITPDGTMAYVSSGDDVTPIDLTTPTPTPQAPVSVGSSPDGIAITPDQAPTAQFSYAVSGTTVAFDASGSSSPVGSIASYAWDFGDGQTETTASSTISHTYSTSDTMTVTLRVTNTAGTSTDVTFTGQMVSNNGGPSARTSQQISFQTGGRIAHFKGKIHRHHHKPYMNTWWSKSTLPNTVKYRIFAYDRKIATITARHKKQKTIHLYPKHHRVGSKKYRHYLENKYNIRAVDASGQVSQSTFVYVKP